MLLASFKNVTNQTILLKIQNMTESSFEKQFLNLNRHLKSYGKKYDFGMRVII